MIKNIKQIINKLLIISLLLFLCSCSLLPIGKNNTYNKLDDYSNATSSDYINLIRNYHVRDKNPNNNKLNKEFEDFLNEYFISVFDDDYLSFHYFFKDYEQFGIKKPEVSWGELDEDKEPLIQEDIDLLNKLHSFNFDSLSYEQQFCYETLEYSIYENLSSLTLDFDYVLLFDSRNDFLSNVVDSLNDYEFYDLESLDDYMVILKDTNRYLNEAIDYTNEVCDEHNYYLTDFSIDYTEEYIDSFISPRTNSLVVSFNERIDKVDFIDENKKKEYIDENQKVVKDSIIPAFKDIRKTIEKQRGKTTSYDNVLINLDSDLAECIFTIDTSCNRDIDDIFTDACITLRSLMEEYITIYNDEDVLNDLERIYKGEIEPLGQDYESIMQFLEDNYTQTHPDLGYIQYELSSLDASSASASVLAYYRQSQLDRPDFNMIKYNPNSFDDGEPWEPYFTLAHEAIPGHMYDFYRFFVNDENKIMRILSYVGVSEGYAKYSEMCASKYLDINEKTQRLLAIENTYSYILNGIFDIAINYYNVDNEYLVELGEYLYMNINDPDYIRDLFVSMYGVYSRYGIGLANMLSLKNNTQEQLGDKFDEKEFNDLLTRNGRLPLVIIEDEINKYAKNK